MYYLSVNTVEGTTNFDFESEAVLLSAFETKRAELRTDWTLRAIAQPDDGDFSCGTVLRSFPEGLSVWDN